MGENVVHFNGPEIAYDELLLNYYYIESSLKVCSQTVCYSTEDSLCSEVHVLSHVQAEGLRLSFKERAQQKLAELASHFPLRTTMNVYCQPFISSAEVIGTTQAATQISRYCTCQLCWGLCQTNGTMCVCILILLIIFTVIIP